MSQPITITLPYAEAFDLLTMIENHSGLEADEFETTEQALIDAIYNKPSDDLPDTDDDTHSVWECENGYLT